MLKRITIAVGALMILAGAMFGQEPAPVPYSVPTPTPEGPAGSVPFLDGIDLPHGDGRFWVSGDYMLNVMRFTRLPALVTTSPQGTDRADAGVLGLPKTSLVFGDEFGDNLRSGFRFGGGFWLNPEHTYSLEADFMMTESQAVNFYANSKGNPILARPFIDANNSTSQAQLVAFPGVLDGSIDIRAGSGNFYGTHIDIVEKSLDCGWFRLDSMIGYRGFSYSDSLDVHQVVSPVGGAFVPNTKITSGDSFGASNYFNGLDMGFRPEFTWKNLTLELVGKLTFGNLREEVNITGNTVITVPGQKTIFQQGGFYALPGNIGTFSNSEWWLMPEAGASLIWEVRPNLKLRVGYSLFVLNGIARAADQVNTTINPNLIPNSGKTGGAAETFSIIRNDSWIQSINIGLIYNY